MRKEGKESDYNILASNLTKPVTVSLLFSLYDTLSFSTQVYVCSVKQPRLGEHQYHRYSRHPVRGKTKDQQRSAALGAFRLIVFTFYIIN